MRKTARRDKVEIYLHLIWTTWDRQPWICPEWEEQLHNVIAGAVDEQRGTLIAVGGIEDHIHILVAIHATTSASELIKSLKGTSATFA